MEPSYELEKQLLVLRRKYEQLFFIEIPLTIGTFQFIFRPMTLYESKAVGSIGPAMPPLEVNEEICKWCVMGGHPIGLHGLIHNGPAALADQVADCILQCSGWDGPDNYVKALNEARKSQDNVEAAAEAFICSAFPGTTRKDIQSMTLKEQTDKLAKAERILNVQVPIGLPEDKKSKRGKQSAEAAWLLSKEAADKVDPVREGMRQREFVTGRDLIDPHHTIK